MSPSMFPHCNIEQCLDVAECQKPDEVCSDEDSIVQATWTATRSVEAGNWKSKRYHDTEERCETVVFSFEGNPRGIGPEVCLF